MILPSALVEHVPEHVTGQEFLQHPEAREMEEKVEGSGQDEAIYRQGGSQCQTVTSDIFAPSGQGVTREVTFVPSNLRPLIFSKPDEGFHMANYSLQTGEEFALEFVKEASKFAMSNSQGRSGLGQVTVPKVDFCETNPYVYEELTGILGIERMASGSNSDISMLTGKRANLSDFGSNCDPLYTESAQGTQIFGSINNGEFQSDERLTAASAGRAEFQHMPYYSTHQSYLSGPSEDSCTGKVKFMCSFGGKILPRPSDGKLRYAGGETRIITVNKDIGYEELMQKMKDNYGQALMLKYQLPDEDLDALVSVSSDEDLENMMEEYKRLEGNEGSSRLRVFLFTVVDVDLTHFDSITDRRKSEQKYVDAVNGIAETGFGKHADSTAGALSLQLENLIGLDVAENQNTTSRAQEDVVASLLLPHSPHDVAKVVHIPGIPPRSSEHTISSASSQTKSTPASSPLSSQLIHFKQSRVADGPLHTFPDQLLQGDGHSSSLVNPPELDHGGPISSSGTLSQNGLHYKFTESRRIPGSPTKAHQDLLPASYLDSMYHGDQGFIDTQLPRVESHGKLNWPQEQFEVVQPILNIRSDDQLCPVDLQRIVHQVSSTVHQPLWQHNLDTDQYIYNRTDYIQQSNSSGELVQQSVQQHSIQIANRNISQLPDHDAAVFRHTDQAQLHQDDAYGGPYMPKSISTDQLEPGVTAATVLQQAGSSPPSPRQVGKGQQHVQGPCPPSAPFVNQHYCGTRVQYYNDQPGRTFNPSTSPCNNEQLPEQFGYQRIFLHEQLPHPDEWFACQQAIPYEQVIHHQALPHVHSDTVLQTHVMKPVNPTYEGIPMSQAHHSDGSVVPKASCVGSDTFQEGFMPFQDFQEIGDLSNQVDNQGSQSQSIFSGQKFYGAVHVSSGLEEQPSSHRHFHGSSDEIDGAVRQKTLKQEENKTHIVMRTRRDHSEVNCEDESSELSRSSHAKPAISYTGMDFPENSSTFLLPCVGDSYQAFEKFEKVEPFGAISYQLKLAKPAGKTGAMGTVTDALQASELTGRINQVAVPWSGSNAQELRTAHPLKDHAFGHHVANTNTQSLTVDQTLLGERVAKMSLNAHLSTAGAEPSIPLSSPDIWWGGMGLDRDHIKAEASMYALGETRNSAEGLPQNTSHLIVNNEMSRPVDSEGVVLDEGSNILSASEHHCAQLLGKSLIDDDGEHSAYLLSDDLSNTRFVDELSSSSSVAMPVSVEGINQTSDLLNHDVIKDIFPRPLNLADDKAGSVDVDQSFEKDITTYLKNEGVALDHVTCQHHSDEEVKGDSKVVEDVITEALRPNIFPAPTLPVCEWDQASEDVRVEQIFCEKVTEVVDEEAITTQDSDFEEAKIEDSDKDEPISDAAIAEAEAIGHGLQIIKNADLEELRELGSGTFGTVYHGKWRGSDVAIKRIKNSCFMGRPSEQERLRADFWREACMLAHLHHPNVVAFYGVVPDGPGGALATVTEYMVNGSLKQVLQRKDRTIDRRKRLLITMDAAFGMEYLHGKNIVHFDLKCENLLVNMRDPQRPICKVGDLGLSKIKHQTLVSGGVRGTLPWMAPELLNGSSSMVSEKVDVFSFGIVMWELLTGEEPYANMHYGAIIGGIVNNTLRPPVPNWCDPAWKSLMEKCWSADPAARPSFTDIANQLRATATSLPLKGQSHQAQLHSHS